MPDKQIFFDPQRKRWKRLRRILDATAVITTLVLAGFIFNVLRGQPLPELLFPAQKHNYKGFRTGLRWRREQSGASDAQKDGPQAVGYPLQHW